MAAGDVTIDVDFVLGQGRGGDIRMMGGTVTLDGSNETPVALASYMASIQMAVVTMDGSAAPAADPNSVTSVISGTTINVYAWKVTTGGAAGNPTEVASANNARLVNWFAIGLKA